MRALIEGLPPRLRNAFLLHYYGGFGVREVAAMLGRPEGTVKADLHHARARLKAALKTRGSPMGDPRDRIDDWLNADVEPLAPRPGTFGKISSERTGGRSAGR